MPTHLRPSLSAATQAVAQAVAQPQKGSSITTTLPQFGQFLGGNCFAEGKATKLSSVWSGRHEEVLKVP